MRRRAWTAGAVATLLGAALWTQAPPSSAAPSVPEAIAHGSLRPATLAVDGGVKRMPFFSGGRLEPLGQVGAPVGAGAARGPGIVVQSAGCAARDRGRNTRVNQDCTYRRQAETDVVADPHDPQNLVVGMNDSLVGFNRTSIDFSVDGGAHWGAVSTAPFGYRLNAPDQLLPTRSDPNRHTIRGGSGTQHSYDACSDPYLAADSQGRFFYTCIGFDIATNASLAFVVPSAPGNKGSAFDQVPAPFGLTAPYTGREHVVSEDDSAAASYDAPKVAADSYAASPHRDNVYFTWTVFDLTCGKTHDQYCESPVWGSMSTDHGFTWSTPEKISGVNRAICTHGDAFTSRPDRGACNLDGHSDIQVRPDGDLAVTFVSQNTAGLDPQILALRCSPSGDSVRGTAHLGCGQPAKVADYVLGPGCDFGRGPEQCIPGAFIRAPFETSQRLAVDERTGDLYDTWYDYRNGEFDVFLSRSGDGGRTWTAPQQVNPDRGTDHYFSAVDVGETGGPQVAISYYRTDRVKGEDDPPAGGFGQGVAKEQSDYVLAGGRGLTVPFTFTVLSPRFPPPDGLQAGFNGDYSGIVVGADGTAHPVWSDTRNRIPDPAFDKGTVDEDVFTVSQRAPGS